jgi:hypothetical protein
MIVPRSLYPAAAAVLLAAILDAAPAHATEMLQRELAQIAGQIQGLMRTDNQAAIAVGEFSGPAQLDTNFGPGVAAALTRALQDRGVTVNRKAALSARGRYAKVPSDRFAGQSMVRLTIEVFDRDDQPRGSFQARFYDTPTIAAFLGVTTALPPDGDLRARNLQVVDAAEKPSAVIEGTRVKSSASSPFAVEVLVRPGPGQPAAPRKPAMVEGQAVVEIKRGEVYEIRLYNQAPFEAAAAILIDGLNVFTFCELKGDNGRPLYSFFPIPPGTALDVVGWFRTLERSDAFVVTAYGEGASSLVRDPPPGKTGVLTVGFLACAPTKEQLPPDERLDARSGEQNETGLGPPQRTQFVQVNRVLGVLRDVVSIRYTH